MICRWYHFNFPPCHPVVPEEFVKIIEDKHFTCGKEDKPRIKENYQRNFGHAMSCATALDYHGMSWGHEKILSLCQALEYCANLEVLYLWGNQLGDAAAIVLAKAFSHCKLLQVLGLQLRLLAA